MTIHPIGKYLLRFLVWLGVTAACTYVGAWIPIAGVAEPWAGDGFAMLMWGSVGLLVGAIAGIALAMTLIK